MSQTSSNRIGVFVDVANLFQNGGLRLRFDVLREFACRENDLPVRLNAYVVFDPEKAEDNPAYRRSQNAFQASLRDYGYKVIQKNVMWYTDEDGRRFGKANCDIDMAVDALLQSEDLSRVLLGTGDGDFVQVVRALQNKGCRVEVLAFDNVSSALKREADVFISGYLIPDLLPDIGPRDAPPWGEVGSTVRGVCYHHSEKGYGFLRYMKHIAPDIWRTDTREEDSPFKSVFFHDSELPTGFSPNGLPNRDQIFEFIIERSDKEDGNLRARDIRIVSSVRRPNGSHSRPAIHPQPPSPSRFITEAERDRDSD